MQAYSPQGGVVELHVQGDVAHESSSSGRGAIQGSKVGGFASIQSPATFGNYWAKHAHKEPNPRSSTESPKWPIRISA